MHIEFSGCFEKIAIPEDYRKLHWILELYEYFGTYSIEFALEYQSLRIQNGRRGWHHLDEVVLSPILNYPRTHGLTFPCHG
jgi:hypothetical protein